MLRRPRMLFVATAVAASLAMPGQSARRGGDVDLTTLVEAPHLGVSDQKGTATCWAWATTSFLEAEMARHGRQPVKLSAMSVARWVYGRKFLQYVRLHGGRWYADGGECTDVLLALREWGLLPSTAYDDARAARARNIDSELSALADAVVASGTGLDAAGDWRGRLEETLDYAFPRLPENFEHGGKAMTPRQFADEVVGLDPDDYIDLTSLSLAPWYEPLALPVPDNWSLALFLNVPADTLDAVALRTLRAGATCVVGLDISEPLAADDVCRLPGNQPPPDDIDRTRLREFDNYSTQDDHALHLVGLASDGDGHLYYKAKNSWGPRRGADGYTYVERAYLRRKALTLLVPRSFARHLLHTETNTTDGRL